MGLFAVQFFVLPPSSRFIFSKVQSCGFSSLLPSLLSSSSRGSKMAFAAAILRFRICMERRGKGFRGGGLFSTSFAVTVLWHFERRKKKRRVNTITMGEANSFYGFGRIVLLSGDSPSSISLLTYCCCCLSISTVFATSTEIIVVTTAHLFFVQAQWQIPSRATSHLRTTLKFLPGKHDFVVFTRFAPQKREGILRDPLWDL